MINKLDNININTFPSSVYNLNGYSLQELLCSFYEHINKTIDLTNTNEENIKNQNLTINNFIDYMKNEGIPPLVIETITKMYNDGRLTELFNSLANNIIDNIENFKTQVNTQMEKKINKNEFVNKNDLKHYKVFDFFPTEIEEMFSQGMCITDTVVNIALVNSDYSKQVIYRFNKTTYEFIDKITFSNLGHCNDMTYIPEKKEIYVANGVKITVLDSETLVFKTELTVDDLSNIHQVAYDKTTNNLAIGNGSTIYIYDLNLNFIKSFNYATPQTKQGIMFVNNLVYISFFERGKLSDYQTTFNSEIARSNFIVVYNLNGEIIKVLNTNAQIGEIESIDLLNDRILMCFNNWYSNKVGSEQLEISLYNAKLFNNDYNIKDYKFDDIPVTLENGYNIEGKTIYVDSEYNGVSDGTISKPYKNLKQAFDYINKYNIFRYVNVNVKNGNYDFVNIDNFKTSLLLTFENVNIKGMRLYNNSSFIRITGVNLTELNNNNNLTIENNNIVNLRGCKFINNTSNTTNSCGIYAINNNKIILDSTPCTFENNFNSAINSYATDIVIENQPLFNGTNIVDVNLHRCSLLGKWNFNGKLNVVNSDVQSKNKHILTGTVNVEYNDGQSVAKTILFDDNNIKNTLNVMITPITGSYDVKYSITEISKTGFKFQLVRPDNVNTTVKWVAIVEY